jgi:hypothetical protein
MTLGAKMAVVKALGAHGGDRTATHVQPDPDQVDIYGTARPSQPRGS